MHDINIEAVNREVVFYDFRGYYVVVSKVFYLRGHNV